MKVNYAMSVNVAIFQPNDRQDNLVGLYDSPSHHLARIRLNTMAGTFGLKRFNKRLRCLSPLQRLTL